MIDLVLQYLRNLVTVWTAPTAGGFSEAYTAYALGTVVLCAHVYVPVFLAKAFGVKAKWLDKLLSYTILLNVVLATAPCALPVLFLVAPFWALHRLRTPQRGARRRPERTPDSEPEDEDDE